MEEYTMIGSASMAFDTELPVQPCAETLSIFIIRPTAQRYGVLFIIFVIYVAG